ncbi:hypothetical protein [Campylobacter ureolyticus]|uniref:Uncharacterized protein n=2 Tax=Campylobacter ureolyticus TaxID=827 RepID=A0AAE7JPK2_9BACT|nr:hypothetical protein [Campylobacter ureolyticus]DAY36706.1 MAG TPA: hypothetical protein [Caudoviricetes sp.]MCR8685211.1 hypothetical protein [Campylobacter ureolyticus]QKF84548.1 hypothetical protein CURT_1070 [Campylobacter ureolyticus]QQY35291.1 hypothetical protein I6I59_07170 [Campylobacter ureolyticus]SUX22246.1 Uncharacterised protein [Campylobacter ureolyticus]
MRALFNAIIIFYILFMSGYILNQNRKIKILQNENLILKDDLIKANANYKYISKEFKKTIEILTVYEANKTANESEIKRQKDEIYKKKDDNKTINPIIYDSVQFVSRRLWSEATTN